MDCPGPRKPVPTWSQKEYIFVDLKANTKHTPKQKSMYGWSSVTKCVWGQSVTAFYCSIHILILLFWGFMVIWCLVIISIYVARCLLKGLERTRPINYWLAIEFIWGFPWMRCYGKIQTSFLANPTALSRPVRITELPSEIRLALTVPLVLLAFTLWPRVDQDPKLVLYIGGKTMHSTFGHSEYQVIVVSVGCFDNLLSCNGGCAKWMKNLS